MRRLLSILIFCLNVGLVWGQDFQETTNSRGTVDPVALKNVLEDIYARQEMDIDDLDTFISSVATTYANKVNYLSNSSATANYGQLSGSRNFAGTTGLTTANVSGFTALGTGNTAIKVKFLSGNTAATEGGTATLAHGLDSSKIAGITVLVEYVSGRYMPPHYTLSAGYEFTWNSDSTNVYVDNHATNSENILGDVIRISIVYFE